MTTRSSGYLLLSCVLALVAGCVSSSLPPGLEPGPRAATPPGAPSTGIRHGDEIVVCGQRFHTGTPVVLWSDPGGYDAYSTSLRFGPAPAGRDAPPDGKRRYHPGRRHGDGPYLVEPGSTDLDEARGAIEQFVLHYDACGTARQCFKILHDVRGLSVHFLLDVDGTLYQTLDLRERAWHAARANTRSVGVEIAHPGSVARSATARVRALEARYEHDGAGPYLVHPAFMQPSGVRTPGFVARPARPERIQGVAQGEVHVQYDYTDEQYEALAHLAAALHEVLPEIEVRAPRGADGRVRTDVLSHPAQDAYDGILGHQHVSEVKTDPGPAFDWEHFLGRTRELLD